MAGRISNAIARQPRKVIEHPQPDVPALLRVELGGEDAAPLQDGAERSPMVGRRYDNLWVLRLAEVGVNEIDHCPLRHPPHEGRVALEVERVPAHVRHLHWPRTVRGE